MLRLILTAAFLMFSLPTFAGENCTCRYNGNDIDEGQTTCMRTPNGMKMAKCSRVLNNTSWIFLEQECPTANLDDTNMPNYSTPASNSANSLSAG